MRLFDEFLHEEIRVQAAQRLDVAGQIGDREPQVIVIAGAAQRPDHLGDAGVALGVDHGAVDLDRGEQAVAL